MTWSVSLIGKPANVAAALDAESQKLSGQCKTEFDAALPHLKGLVEQNFAKPDSGCTEPVLKLEANGSGYARQSGDDVEQINRSCSVNLQLFHTRLV